MKALVDNPSVAGKTVKQTNLKFLDLQLPPTCPVDNLVHELNYLSEALSSCSADHLEGSFHFIPSASVATKCALVNLGSNFFCSCLWEER